MFPLVPCREPQGSLPAEGGEEGGGGVLNGVQTGYVSLPSCARFSSHQTFSSGLVSCPLEASRYATRSLECCCSQRRLVWIFVLSNSSQTGPVE